MTRRLALAAGALSLLLASVLPVMAQSLDVDGINGIDVATDVVYIARHLSGLDPVPASFRQRIPGIPPSNQIVPRIEAVRAMLDVDGINGVDVATDVVYIARHLSGVLPVPGSFRTRIEGIPSDTFIAGRIELLRIPTPTRTATPTVPTPTRTATPTVPTPTRTATQTVPTPTRTATPTVPTPTRTATPTVPTPTRTMQASVEALVVANSGSSRADGNLSYFVPSTSRLVRYDGGPNAPDSIALSKNGRLAFLLNESTNHLSVWDATTFAYRKRVMVGARPTSMAIDRSGTVAYVTNADSHDISVVDIKDADAPGDGGLVVSRSIPLGKRCRTGPATPCTTNDQCPADPRGRRVCEDLRPMGIALANDGRAYVISRSSSCDEESGALADPSGATRKDTVAVIDTANPSATPRMIDVRICPTSLAMDRNQTAMYVLSDANPPSVSIINTADNSLLPEIKRDMPARSAPSRIALSPTQDLAIISSTNASKITFINTQSREVTRSIDAGGMLPVGVAFSADGRRAYVANSGSNKVAIINTQDQALVGTLDVGANPRALAVTGAGSTASAASTLTASGASRALRRTAIEPEPLQAPPTGQLAYVANRDDNSVSVLDLGAGTPEFGEEVANIPLGCQTGAVALSPNGARVYVVDRMLNRLFVVDTASNTIDAVVGVGIEPAGVAVTPNGAFVYVTNSGSDSISVIDAATNAIVDRIDLPAEDRGPTGIAIRPDGAVAYVANRASGTVVVIGIDTPQRTILARRQVGGSPESIAVRGDGLVYVTDAQRSAISGIVGDQVTSIQLPVAANDFATNVAFTPDGQLAYVLTLNGLVRIANGVPALVPGLGAGGIGGGLALTNTTAYLMRGADLLAISTATSVVTGTIGLGLEGAGRVAISADGQRAYVTKSAFGSVLRVVPSTGAVAAAIYGGCAPSAVATNGVKTYVANADSSTVTVIDNTTNTPSKLVTLGAKNPNGVAFTPDGDFAWVTTPNSNTVYVLNAATDQLVDEISLSVQPSVSDGLSGGIAFSPNGRQVYVGGVTTDADGNVVSGGIVVFDRQTQGKTAIRNVDSPLGLSVSPLAGSPFGLVANSIKNTAIAFDTGQNELVEAIAAGLKPRAVAITAPDGQTALLTNFGSDSVSIIDTATNAVRVTLAGGFSPNSVALVPGGSLAYVTNPRTGTVTVLDSGALVVRKVIPVRDGAAGIAIAPRPSSVPSPTSTRTISPTAVVVGTATPTAQACAPISIGSVVPLTQGGSTVGAPNTVGGSCGGGSAPDRTFLFTAPTSGTYVIATEVSSFDTVLHVRDGGCSGAQIACSDSIGGTAQVILALSAGQTIMIAVDGFGALSGSFVLSIRSGSATATPTPVGAVCPQETLPSILPIENLTRATAGTVSYQSGSCGGVSAPERTFLFTAPSSASYTFDTVGSSFDTVLHVREGFEQSCFGFELGCNDNTTGTSSQVTRFLNQGSSVIVIIDGRGPSDVGQFRLNVRASTSVPACPEATLMGALPVTTTGTTGTALDTQSPACAFSTAPDRTFRFTAPAAGSYTIDTNGSQYDTVLNVRDGSCTGAQLACNDDGGVAGASQVTLNLNQGQSIVIAVDGYAESQGNFTVRVANTGATSTATATRTPTRTGTPTPTQSGGTCPATNLGMVVPTVIAGDTFGGVNAFRGTCGADGSPERAFGFTAPSTGTYTFDTVGSSYDTVLYVRSDACGGAELACNDDVDFTLASQVVLPLTAGQRVVVLVDGYGGSAGSFNLRVGFTAGAITPISTPTRTQTPTITPTAGACPGQVLSSTVPLSVSGSTLGLPDALGSACGNGATGGERTFQYVAPSTGMYTVDTFGSSFDTVLSVRDGTCSAPEIACNDEFVSSTSQVTVSLTAGQVIVIVVDGFNGSRGNFNLNIARAGTPTPTSTRTVTATPTRTATGSPVVCPATSLGSTLPVSVSGTTVGQPNLLTSACGGASGERTFGFTAPVTGLYTIDTVGSSFDTVLSVRDSSCAGVELACNDDQPGGTTMVSEVTLNLTAGSTIVVVVDSFGSQGGPFTLNINQGASAVSCQTAGNVVANCGFELGDFTAWTVEDLTSPLLPLLVSASGQGTGFGFFFSQPTEGIFSAVHGFDGEGPGSIRLSQVVTLPVGVTALRFDYRAAWDLLNYGATQGRQFFVDVLAPQGGPLLQSTLVLTAPQGTVQSDTGVISGAVDVSTFAGTSVRLRFRWDVPEVYSGPAFFELDNVVVRAGAVTPTPTPVGTPRIFNVEPGESLLGPDDTRSALFTSALSSVNAADRIVGDPLRLALGVVGANGIAPLRLTQNATLSIELIDASCVCVKLFAEGSSGTVDCDGGTAYDTRVSQPGDVPVAWAIDTGLGAPASAGNGGLLVTGVFDTVPNTCSIANCSGRTYINPVTQFPLTTTNATAIKGTLNLTVRGEPFNCINFAAPGQGMLAMGAPLTFSGVGAVANVLRLGELQPVFTPTVTGTPTRSRTATASVTRTSTPPSTVSATVTNTPTRTATPPSTPTGTPTRTATQTATFTPATPSSTPTRTVTPTPQPRSCCVCLGCSPAPSCTDGFVSATFCQTQCLLDCGTSGHVFGVEDLCFDGCRGYPVVPTTTPTVTRTFTQTRTPSRTRTPTPP